VLFKPSSFSSAGLISFTYLSFNLVAIFHPSLLQS
jgi:hypothetical protein